MRECLVYFSLTKSDMRWSGPNTPVSVFGSSHLHLFLNNTLSSRSYQLTSCRGTHSRTTIKMMENSVAPDQLMYLFRFLSQIQNMVDGNS